MSDEDKVKAAIQALRGVLACFKARTESSTCIEDHHPSCQQYIAGVLAKLQGDKDA
jgi:hypothetical protein